MKIVVTWKYPYSNKYYHMCFDEFEWGRYTGFIYSLYNTGAIDVNKYSITKNEFMLLCLMGLL